MQTTTNYGLSKPEYTDEADIAPISGNMDVIDIAMNKARTRDADLFDENAEYNTGDFCIYTDVLHRCNADGVTGPWDSTKWDATTIAQAFEPKHKWSLFETITADGTSGRVESTLPPRCTGVIMKYHLTASATDSAGFHSVKFVNESGRLTFNYLSAIVTNADRYGEARIIADGNFWQAEFTSAGANATSTLTEYLRQNAFRITDAFLENIRFDTTGTPAVNIPSGSTFEIYIRR